MADEEHQPTAPAGPIVTEKKQTPAAPGVSAKKNETSLYAEPTAKCYIGQGNNSEL